MIINDIEKSFCEKVSSKVRLKQEGESQYRILTPFMFEDGDHFTVMLRQEGSRWLITDNGHTYMHLSYDLDEKDLHKGTRQKIISNVLSMFHVEDKDGELLIPVNDDRYGDSLFSFLQAIVKISDL